MSSTVSSAIIGALDNFTPSQIGEKGTKEYTWSNNCRERIVQLNFQLTRTNGEDKLQILANIYSGILSEVMDSHKVNRIGREEYLDLMSILFRLIGHTRDTINGKGEYMLSYKLIEALNAKHPNLAEFAFKSFFVSTDSNSQPFGSWKDVKGFYDKCGSNPQNRNLIEYGKRLILEQLRTDLSSENPTLVAKWVPREKSHNGKLFNELAEDYFKHYLDTATTEESKRKASIKARMEFRKIISSLNKKLDTVQVKQCAKQWQEIDPAKQTSVTMHRQKKAFLNLKKDGTQRFDDEDRIACAANFRSFAKKAVAGEVEIKGSKVGLNDFTCNALQFAKYNNEDEKNILNAQWRNNSSQTGALGKMIAMVDTSGSMYGDPLNAAIALGIRVAEKSLLGKRVMTFDSSPSWINLEGEENFVDMAIKINNASWGMNTNFAAALSMILDAIIESKLKPEDVEDIVLAVFSDMQMDHADQNDSSLMASIERKYAETGIRLWGKPFKAPHILFWNLRSTSGFPTLSTKSNASMMSGFSPVLLNLFCEEGLDALQSCTPWSIFLKTLANERYNEMDSYLRAVL